MNLFTLEPSSILSSCGLTREERNENNEIIKHTLFSNRIYMVSVIEDKKGVHAYVKILNKEYPKITNDGVEISEQGSMNAKKLNDYMEKLVIARDTYIQILRLREGIKIK